MSLNGIDFGVIFLYLLITVGLGIYLGRRIKTGRDYFLGGRKLPWWAIGMSLVVSDIGAIDIVGIAGSAYLYGIVMGNFDWIGCVPVMVIAAFLFIPMFWKAEVSTVPEWLGLRYNLSVRTISAVIWGAFLACNLGIMLYATAVMLNVLLDLNPKVMIVAEEPAVFEGVQARVGAKDFQFYFVQPGDDVAALVAREDPNIVMVDAAIAQPPPVWAEALHATERSPLVLFSGVLTDSGARDWVVPTEGGELSVAEAVGELGRPARWNLMYSIILMGVVIGLYTFFGGLTAVVYTDVIQCAVMMVGCFFTLFYGIHRLGGLGAFMEAVRGLGERTQDHFHLILPADTVTPYPWSGIFLGLGMVLASAYWIGNQSIVQRSFAARSEGEAKAAYLWGALLKVLIPFAVVVPGIIALAHNPNVGDADKAMAVLIRDIMPPGLLGIFFGAFLAALMSSVDSCLNSAATLWTKDIYQRFFRPQATDHHLLVVGRAWTVVFIIWGILFGRFSARFESIYTLIQTLLTLFQGPSLAIIILGVLWSRTTGHGALAGLLSGLGCSGGLLWINAHASDPLFRIADPYLYIAWWSFVISLAVTAVVSLMTPREPEEKLRGLVYRWDRRNPRPGKEAA